jgi:hypothetical protein
LGIALIFMAGFFSHLLYRRWNTHAPMNDAERPAGHVQPETPSGRTHPVTFAPLSPPAEPAAQPPVLPARDVDGIRALTGRQARIRGRIFRVGHSAKSNTHFLNFGPSRGALTAVIFASALERFEKQRVSPKKLEGREVEIVGEVKDHPQYGLEVILEGPEQVKVME